jgi:hypothetical protein
MTPLLRQPLSRRTVLRGSGVALSLPLLDIMMAEPACASPSRFKPLAKSQAKPVPRVVFCYVPNGVNIQEWLPNPASDSGLSPTLAALGRHRSALTVLTGLGHPNATGGHSGADTWLTGANLKAVPGKDYTNTVSADQIIAGAVGSATRLPSLELGDASGTGSALHSHTLSFDRNGTPLPVENNPRRLFERLFVPDDASSREATLRRYAERKSILDNILADAKALRQTLGTADRQKLDQYLESVRETERRLARLVEWVDVPKPIVPTEGLQLASKPGDGHDRPMWLDVMLELAYLAFATDTTRVITFEWSREAGGVGGAGENHHELSHHGGDPGMLARLAAIDRFHVERLARFLDFLKATPEGGGTMLDHVMVMYGSGMNSGDKGDHSPRNLPLLVAGGSAWGLRHGRNLQHNPERHPPLSNVLVTLQQKMGIETDRFQDATGTLTGLA